MERTRRHRAHTNMYEGNPRVKVIAVPDVDPVTGESNFEYEFSGFTKEFLKTSNY